MDLRTWLDHNDLHPLRSGVLRVRWTEFGWQTALVLVLIGYLFMVAVGHGHSPEGNRWVAAGCFLAGLSLLPFGVRRRQVELFAEPARRGEGPDQRPLDPEALVVRALGGDTFAVFSPEERLGPTRRSPEAAQRDLRLLQAFFAPSAHPPALQLAARARRRAPSCPYCRDELRRREVVCDRCGTELHAECAREHGGCTSAGCEGRLRRARRAA